MKKVIIVLMLILLSSVAYGALSDNLINYWDFNTDCATNEINASNTFTIDGTTDCTNYGGINEIGFYGNSGSLDADAFLSYPSETYNFWFNVSSAGNGYLGWIGSNFAFNTIDWYSYAQASNDRSVLQMAIGGGGCPELATPDNMVKDNSWTMITYVFNSTGAKIYINGTLQASGSCGGTRNTGTGVLHLHEQNADKGVGMLDEVSHFQRELSVSEIEELWNSGAGTFYPFGGAAGTPTAQYVSPPTPISGYINNTLGQNISVSCSENGHPLIYAGNTNPPTTLVKTETETNITYWIINSSIFNTDDTWYYQGNCSNSTHVGTAVRSFVLDTSEPPIYLGSNSFVKTTNYSNINPYNESINLTLNLSVADDRDLNTVLIEINSSSGTNYFQYENTTLTGLTFWNYTTIINHSTYPADTLYLLDIWASDSHTKYEICPLNDDCYKPKKISNGLDFKTPEGNHIWIVSKDAADLTANKNTDRYSFNIDFADGLEKKRVINLYSETPLIYHGNKSGFLAHFTTKILDYNMGGNWIDFETNGIVEGTAKVKKISDYHYEITFDKLKDKLTFESIGGLNINHESYSWYKGTYTETKGTAVSGLPFDFTLNITRGSSIKNITAELTFNGTIYTLTETIGAGFNYYNKTFFFSVDSDSDFEYYWNITATQNDTSYFNFLISDNHSVSTLILDNCSTATTLAAIFYLKDESSPSTALNGTMEIEASYSTGTSTPKTLTASYPSNTTFKLCLSPAGSEINVDAYIKYTIPTGFTHRYYWVNETLSSTTKSINLYNFNTTTGISDLKITVRQIADFAYFANVYGLLQRRYLDEGVWRTVQMDKSGDFGQLFYNIIEENTDYRLIFWDSTGRTLSTTNSLKFICSSGVCDITQKLNPYSTASSSFNTTFDVSFNNASNQLNASWNNPKGLSTTVNITVTRETFTGTATICSYQAAGAAGLLNCDTSGYSGLFLVTFYENGNWAYTEYVQTDDETLSDVISAAEGAIWTFGIMVTIIMFGLFSPAGVVMATILGLILVAVLGIFNPISTTFVIIACIVGIAISLKVKN